MILSLLNASLIQGQEVAHLTADKASGSSALTVDNISGFSIGKFVLLGNFGEPTAEIIRIHTVTTPSGTTITLNSNTVNDHFAGTPVTIIDYDQVEFSRATTLAGSKSVLATNSVSADRMETAYSDLTNSTGYGFARFKNSASGAFSGYSDGVNYTGSTVNSFGELVAEGCSFTGATIGGDYASETDLYRDLNACQREIAQMQDWEFELVTDLTSIATTENENEYSLSSLTYALKILDSNKSVLDVRIGSSAPLAYISPDEMDREFAGVKHGYLSAIATVGATSITLTDSYDFSESGTVILGQNNGVAYTANAQSTGVLSGISASAITVQVASGGSVWQGVNPGLPTKYTILNNTIIFNVPISSTYAGQKVKIKYLKKMADVTSFGTETDVKFFNAIPFYIAFRIEARKRNFDIAQGFYVQFKELSTAAMSIYLAPTLDGMSYYNFADGIGISGEDIDEND